jgi:hypothetical protein
MSPEKVKIPEPFPLGAKYRGDRIIAVLQTDENDPKHPYQYYLAGGMKLWIRSTAKYDPKKNTVK